MPFYEYRCDAGHRFEVMQRMSDDPVAECSSCGRPVQRVFHPVAVHFKGSGFYNTDYGKRKRGAGASEDSSSGGDGGGGGESKKSDSSAAPASTKDKKSSSTSSSSSSSSSSD
jgi:putative FmdB family regulatory protein